MTSNTTSSKVGHVLAKGLGIKVNYRDEIGHEGVSRGESVFSVDSADSFVEREPTAGEWLRGLVLTPKQIGAWLYSLFPFVHWLPFYNWQWLIGDLVAGITVGAVVVPQGMAYAALASLPAQFGLYTSFMGVLIYWFFATSKDITIGPVAVMSTVTGTIVDAARKQYPKDYVGANGIKIASSLAIICGAIVFFIGFFRLGRIVNFISLTIISAFMTGSAISIAAGQVPTMMGITGFDTRASTYKVIINTLKGLPRTNLNAAMGLTALFLLYAIRSTFNSLARRFPQKKKAFFFANTLRTVFVILLYTLVSWLVNRNLPGHNASKAPFKILGTVPRGFQNAGVPQVTTKEIRTFLSALPGAVIVLLIEHIAISKSFGRVNGYKIDPSQELVAIGVTNLLGPFLGAYPATGSFSRTAIKAKAGVRTPLAGVITAIVVLLAIYALPAVFFYIPNASLAAVIIHAVGDLITPPNTVWQFWRTSPLEAVIFFIGVIVIIFSTIEDGMYVILCVSLAIVLWRALFARGRVVGKVQIHSVVGDAVLEEQKHRSGATGAAADPQSRTVFLPIDHNDGSNPNLAIRQPYPGVFIYRFSENLIYANADHYMEDFTDFIFERTRRTNPNAYPRLGDRPWNNPGVSRKQGVDVEADKGKPTLKAVILDFSAVNNTDVTSIQELIDVRNQLDRYASPDVVHWHFANITNRWTRRALAVGGFGYPTPPAEGDSHRWKPIFSVAEIGGHSSVANEEEYDYNRRRNTLGDIETVSHGDAHNGAGYDKSIADSQAYNASRTGGSKFVVGGINRPLFHVDVIAALQSAIANVEHRSDKYPDSESDAELQKPTVVA